jgi:hypothetical protein
MYLDDPSIIRLAAFLRGYDLAAEKLGGRTPDPFEPAFRNWIYQRFQSSQLTWEETILLHCVNEADAMRRFWELLDEFLAERPRNDDFEDAAKHVLQKNAVLYRRLG